jgi:hypothetical protein
VVVDKAVLEAGVEAKVAVVAAVVAEGTSVVAVAEKGNRLEYTPLTFFEFLLDNLSATIEPTLSFLDLV